MSVQTIKVLVPLPVAMPRGALWASRLFSGLKRCGAAVWRSLEAEGWSRAERELRDLATRYPGRPEFAQALRESMHRAAMQRDS